MNAIVLPILGACKSHLWGIRSGTLPPMGKSAKLQLRDNLRRVMADAVARFTELVESGAVTKSSLDRLIDDEGQSVRLEQLDKLAYALQVEPWQLLHPDFDTAMISEWGMKAARKMDSLPDHIKPRAYGRFVQDVDFANAAAGQPEGSSPDDGASAPGIVRPRRLRRIPR